MGEAELSHCLSFHCDPALQRMPRELRAGDHVWRRASTRELWTQQCTSLCCSQGGVVQLARSAYSTLSPMNRVLYEETDNTSALLTDAVVWQPTALHDKTMRKWGFDEQ